MVAPGGMHSCSGGHVCLLFGGVVTRGACMVALGGMHGCSQGACVVAPGGMGGCSGGGVHGCSQGACIVALGGMGGCSQGGRAWDTTRYGDTVNERAVRILLECILVYIHKVF